MKKVLSVFLSVILALTFVTCVYLHGKEEVFSLEQWISNLAEFGGLVSFRDVVDCWTEDYYVKHYWKEVELEDGGVGYVETYENVYYEDYTGTSETLQFFDVLRGFFRRLFRSFVMIFEVIADLFTNADRLLPWNATVPKEVIFDVV